MTGVRLQAGSLSLLLHPDEGSISHIRWNGTEVLRGVGAPIRDVAWATVPPAIEDLAIVRKPDAFHVTFSARCQAGAIDVRWRGEISGSAAGVLSFIFSGEALAGFAANRIGFAVLHPAEAAGAPVVVEHTDGRIQFAAFPENISPHQPFLDVRALTHETSGGLNIEVRMEGDAFETEDQRNWTDASFKTYCTPLAGPRPLVFHASDRIRQTITLRIRETAALAASAQVAPHSRPPRPYISARPQLGTCWMGEPTPAVIDALRPLQLDHLRVDLWPASLNDGLSALPKAAAAAAALGAGLELAVFTHDSGAKDIHRLLEALCALPAAPRIARWLVLPERLDTMAAQELSAIRRLIPGTTFDAPVGCGSTENFTELNRGDPGLFAAAQFTVHGCNPQYHAFDDESLFETLPIQGLTVVNARRISGGLPAVVSPVTLTRRWRKGETGEPRSIPVDLPTGLMPLRSDPRLAMAFTTEWVAGSLTELAQAGAASVTLFEAIGENGLVTPSGQPRPAYEGIRRFLARSPS